VRLDTSNLFLLVDEASVAGVIFARVHKLVVVNIVFTVLCMSWFESSLDSLRFFRLLQRCVGLIPRQRSPA